MNDNTSTNILRPEYPRPQFVREDWINLNGEWDFEIDYSCTGQEREFFNRDALDSKNTVPFCPESKLSGICNTDFMPCVWYRRDMDIPNQFKDKEVILHFGAVDYHAIVYVNGTQVIEHKGGYTPFSVNITEQLKDKNNYITLCAYDDLRSNNQPSAKSPDNRAIPSLFKISAFSPSSPYSLPDDTPTESLSAKTPVGITVLMLSAAQIINEHIHKNFFTTIPPVY